MPGTPSTSPVFGAPRFANADPADFSTQVNGVTDAFDAKAALRALLPPVGAQMPYVGTTDPPAVDGIAAWLICDGRLVNSTDYPALDALIGAAAGVGAGRHLYNAGAAPAAGQFKLPDKRGRVAVAAGTATGARGATAKTSGVRGGEETHQLGTSEMPTHSHGGGNHQHGLTATPLSPSGTHYAFASAAGPAEIALMSNVTQSSGNTIAAEGGGVDHNNLPPYEVDGGYIIRAR